MAGERRTGERRAEERRTDGDAGNGSGGPDHPDEQAELRERSEGAHSEQISDEANLRADPSPPGIDDDVDPDQQSL